MIKFRRIKNRFSHPVVTLCIEEKDKRTFNISIAVCNACDDFNVKAGRELAQARLTKTPRSYNNNRLSLRMLDVIDGGCIAVRKTAMADAVLWLNLHFYNHMHNDKSIAQNTVHAMRNEIKRLNRDLNNLRQCHTVPAASVFPWLRQ